MTQCIDQLSFGNLHGKQITAAFDGGNVSTDGGVLLVTEADRKLGLTGTLGGSLRDTRQAAKVSHIFADMLAQRVYQIACGYEDCNDADDLRYDPMFKTAIGRLPESEGALADWRRCIGLVPGLACAAREPNGANAHQCSGCHWSRGSGRAGYDRATGTRTR